MSQCLGALRRRGGQPVAQGTKVRFMENAILVGTHALDELRELASSAGARIIEEVIQRRERPDPATFIGKGKVEELREQILIEGVDVVIFDQELSPSQAKNLEEALDTKVVDR